MRILIFLIAGASLALSAEESNDTDGDQSRKILGSSVVTSVSVIMDTGNGSKAVFTDAVGRPVPKPSSASEVASPINLLNPDRYEFYTFDDNGDLIKRLMSLEEIQGIIATGDSDGYDLDMFTSLGYLPEKRVNDVVNNVQSVLKEEMETHKNSPDIKPMFDTPDVSDSWSMILPAVFGNSGEDIKPEKPIAHVTPDTIMIEPNMENTYLTSTSTRSTPISSTVKPPKQTVMTPPTTTTVNTPGSTKKPYISSIQPLVVSTPTQISTTDKLITINTGTTNKIPSLTPVTEQKLEPLINVEIYSNSKSTEKPVEQQGTENSAFVEIKPPDTIQNEGKPSYESYITTKKPLTTPNIAPFSMKPSTQTEIESKTTLEIDSSTNSPLTLVTFIPSSTSSALPTIKFNTTTSTQSVHTSYTLSTTNTATPTTEGIPVLTKRTTEAPLSTWRPELSNTDTTEPPKATEGLFSTIKTELTSTDVIQELTTKEQPQNDFPTLADLLNLETKQTEPPSTTTTSSDDIYSDELTTFSIGSGVKNQEITTDLTTHSSHTKLPEKSEDDLSTLGSEYFSTKSNLLTTQQIVETTQLPLEQSLNTAQKISASELLDQLLYTTNIEEINTELAEKATAQQTFSDDDERFETTTREETKISEIKTEIPTTTEEFIIKVMDNAESPTTDKTLIDSIEQLLSQAVGNVEEALASINDTEKIQNMLINSGKKNMTEIQEESATLASTMVDTNFDSKVETDKTTTEFPKVETTLADESIILSESVGSLLSQIYDSNQPNMTTIEYPVPTEKYPTTSALDRNTEDILTSITTQKYEETINLSNDDIPENKLFEEEKTTTVIDSTTLNYVPLNLLSSNDSDKNSAPLLINLTIISSENMKNGNKNRTKPAKSDISLEQTLDEQLKKNLTNILKENEFTKLYNETDSATENSNENIDITKSPNEILNAEETMSALYNSTQVNETIDANASQNVDVTESSVLLNPLKETESEVSTEENSQLTTTDSFIPIKEIPKISENPPTTIVIIKRTKTPLTEEPTTVLPFKEINLNTETTTTFDEKLDSTTYSKQETEFTEIFTEKILPTTTELTQEDLTLENTTEKEAEPAVEVIISENSKSSLEDANSQMPENEPVSSATPHSETANKPEEYESIKPQESSNINVKISSNTLPGHKENSGGTPYKTLHNEDEKVSVNKSESTWTLVPTIAPHSDERIVQNYSPSIQNFPEIIEPPAPIDLVAKPLQGFGLEDSTSRLDTDIYQFAQLCNELAFGFWKTVTSGISSARSVFVSPFGATSLLAMVFLGARGATSGEMNEILRLDDMVTFNPHLIFKNVSESIKTDEPDSGVVSSAIIRELFSDRSKGKLLPFYKERAKAFYDGYVEEVSFREIGDVIRRRTNLQVKKYTNGKITEFLKDSSVTARSPLAGVSVNIFQTDCSQASTDGRDGELHFVVLPSIRQRRLIPVPAVVYKSGFLAGYEPSLDATAISLGTKDQTVSTILVIPGQQGIAAPGDGLARLEKRLVESSFKKGAWSRLLRSLIPRPGLEVQIPRFSHRSVINATVTLKRMGLHDLFDVEKADLRGLNGVANELYLSDMLQINSFATCGEKRISDTHHSEIYPATASSTRNSRYLENYQNEDTYYRSDLLEEPRDYQRAFHDPLHDPSYLSLPLPLRPRQARVPETPRLKFDRPFIYFVRHNPTGLILHMGRFNPRLLP